MIYVSCVIEHLILHMHMSLQRTEHLLLLGKSYNIFSYKYIPKEITVHYISILRISVENTTKNANSLFLFVFFF